MPQSEEKSIDKNIQTIVASIIQQSPVYLDQCYDRCLLPINYVLKNCTQLTSKQLRVSLTSLQNNPPKLIENPCPELLLSLGNNIKKLTNTRIKTILLRAIHGDIYCGTRLKKFGLSDLDQCPRCSEPETIQHQLIDCAYVKKIWEIMTKLTSIPVRTLNDVLGHNPLHDRITLTTHGEIIRVLLAINRPTLEQITLVKHVINRLGVVERNISKHQIMKMSDILNSLT